MKHSCNQSAESPTYPAEADLCIRIAGGEVLLWLRGGTQSSGAIAHALFGTVGVKSAPFISAFKGTHFGAAWPLAGTAAQSQIRNQKVDDWSTPVPIFKGAY